MSTIRFVPESMEAEVILAAAEKQASQRPCEHEECPAFVVDGWDYCEEHVEHYYCECGQRLEDAAGSPGDGFCGACR